MALAAPSTGWLRGIVKAVPSGDSLVIMGNTKTEIPPEKTITLSSLMAPKLVCSVFMYVVLYDFWLIRPYLRMPVSLFDDGILSKSSIHLHLSLLLLFKYRLQKEVGLMSRLHG